MVISPAGPKNPPTYRPPNGLALKMGFMPHKTQYDAQTARRIKGPHFMQIAFHIGANCTDEDRLLKSILKNADVLLQQGIAVPGPGKYRKLIRDAIQQIDGASPRPDTRDILIDAIVEDDSLKRIVMTNDNFIAIPKRIFDHGLFYSQIDDKLRSLQRIFRQDDLSLFLSIRNQASFLQETTRRVEGLTLPQYLGLLTPEDLYWSDVVARIKRAAPFAQLHVWCNEDTPLIWEELIRLQSGIAPGAPVAGTYDLLGHILTPEGLAAAKAQLEDGAPLDTADRQNIIADALEAYAKPELLEDQIDLPELDEHTVAVLTQNYDDDLEEIDAMDGVTLILPSI